VIVTDGQENASREFTGAQVRKMIAEAKEAGWQFVFLSADESAISDSSSLNIDASNAAFFKKSKAGSSEMWERVANRSVAFRRSEVHCMRMDEAADDAAIAQKLRAQNAGGDGGGASGGAQNPSASVARRKIRMPAWQFRHGANEAVVAAVAKRIERLGVCRGLSALRCACY